MTDPKLVDISCEVMGETNAAYRIYDGTTTEWIPKSQVELHREGRNTVVVMPEWLAKDKGFI